MRFTTITSLKPAEVLSMARSYFEGLGLNLTDETDRRVVMEGDKGFIAVQLRGVEGREVDVITEGMDRPAKDFLKRLG
jgi:hypothetical protein